MRERLAGTSSGAPASIDAKQRFSDSGCQVQEGLQAQALTPLVAATLLAGAGRAIHHLALLLLLLLLLPTEGGRRRRAEPSIRAPPRGTGAA